VLLAYHYLFNQRRSVITHRIRREEKASNYILSCLKASPLVLDSCQSILLSDQYRLAGLKVFLFRPFQLQYRVAEASNPRTGAGNPPFVVVCGSSGRTFHLSVSRWLPATDRCWPAREPQRTTQRNHRLPLSARILLDLQTLVSRESNPTDPAVVMVGSIHGGSKHNIIPNTVHLKLTVRTTKNSIFKHRIASLGKSVYYASGRVR